MQDGDAGRAGAEARGREGDGGAPREDQAGLSAEHRVVGLLDGVSASLEVPGAAVEDRKRSVRAGAGDDTDVTGGALLPRQALPRVEDQAARGGSVDPGEEADGDVDAVVPDVVRPVPLVPGLDGLAWADEEGIRALLVDAERPAGEGAAVARPFRVGTGVPAGASGSASEPVLDGEPLLAPGPGEDLIDGRHDAHQDSFRDAIPSGGRSVTGGEPALRNRRNGNSGSLSRYESATCDGGADGRPALRAPRCP